MTSVLGVDSDLALRLGWLSIDDGGRIVAAGAAASRLLGAGPDELVGRSLHEVLHPDDLWAISAVREHLGSELVEQVAQFRIRAHDGNWVRVEATLRDVGLGVLVADLVDISAGYVRTEGLAVLAEVRRLVDAAADLDQAWSAAIDCVASRGGFGRWARWIPSGNGDLDLSTDRPTWRRATVSHDEPVVGLDLERAVDIAASADRWGWVHELVDAPPLDSPGALLIPITSRDQVIAVIELADQRELVEHSTLALIVEVARELGDGLQRRELDRTVALEQQRFDLAFEQAAIGMVLVAPDGTLLRANQSCCHMLGRSEAELLEVGSQEITHPDDLDRDVEYVRQMLDGEIDTYQMEKRYLRPDGKAIWGLLSVSLVRDESGEPLHLICQIQDIDRKRAAQAALERTVALFAAAFDGAATGMLLVGLDGTERSLISASNARFRSLTAELGFTTGLQRFRDFSESADDWLHEIARRDDEGLDTYVSERSVIGPHAQRWVRLSAAPVRTGVTEGRYVIVHVEDITEQRRAQSELAFNALHDGLTGLPNRALISERIRHAQERSDRTGNHLGVLFIDLDNFKDVNDSLGHHAGDELLREVARRFAASIRPSDTAARLGGDEFVILCEDLDIDPEVALVELSEVASRLHRALDGSIEFEQGEGWVSASIGQLVLTGSMQSVATVLGNADVAMYRAKANGRSRTEVFDSAMRRAAVERVHIAGELHRAIERDQLWCAFQPIVRLDDRTVTGAEALLRWDHPELGPVAPDRFIDVAEESELIVELGEFVVDAVCEALVEHPELGYITMNVSARQLTLSSFADMLLAQAASRGIAPERIAIELTENVLMDAGGSSLRQLEELRAAGMPIGVDDFGTGFASLTYLRRLPVSFVKVDKSFVDGILDDPDDRTIVEGTIGLAHSLGLNLVAEGVETPAQATLLRQLGCQLGQGYHFGRPAAEVVTSL